MIEVGFVPPAARGVRGRTGPDSNRCAAYEERGVVVEQLGHTGCVGTHDRHAQRECLDDREPESFGPMERDHPERVAQQADEFATRQPPIDHDDVVAVGQSAESVERRRVEVAVPDLDQQAWPFARRERASEGLDRASRVLAGEGAGTVAQGDKAWRRGCREITRRGFAEQHRRRDGSDGYVHHRPEKIGDELRMDPEPVEAPHRFSPGARRGIDLVRPYTHRHAARGEPDSCSPPPRQLRRVHAHDDGIRGGVVASQRQVERSAGTGIAVTDLLPWLRQDVQGDVAASRGERVRVTPSGLTEPETVGQEPGDDHPRIPRQDGAKLPGPASVTTHAGS